MAQENDDVLTLICLKCGTDYRFSGGEAPADLVCEKCGNKVFRPFESHTESDEAADDFTETTDRDLDTDEAEGDTQPGDVLDLNRD